MYKLTLTHEERKAIDWIGDRYRHGYELFTLIWGHGVKVKPANKEWSEDVDLIFEIPEHIAWQIREIIDEDNCSLACLSSQFAWKLIEWSDQIV